MRVEMGVGGPLSFSSVNRGYALGCALLPRSHTQCTAAIVVT